MHSFRLKIRIDTAFRFRPFLSGFRTIPSFRQKIYFQQIVSTLPIRINTTSDYNQNDSHRDRNDDFREIVITCYLYQKRLILFPQVHSNITTTLGLFLLRLHLHISRVFFPIVDNACSRILSLNYYAFSIPHSRATTTFQECETALRLFPLGFQFFDR